MDRKYLWKLNSSEQNDQLVRELITGNYRTVIKELLANSFPLSAFVLNEMYYHGWQFDELKSVISISTVIKDDVKVWISAFFDAKDVRDLYLAKPELRLEDFPSDDDCIQLGLWQILCLRGKWDIVALHAPQVLEQTNCLNSSRALLNVDFDKYASLAWKRGHYGAFHSVKNGWKYLIDHGYIRWLSEINSCGDLFPVNDICSYCVNKGLVDELYLAEFYHELLVCGQFDVFIKNHSFYGEFLESYPDRVDWEDLWQHCPGRSDKEYLLHQAYQNREVQKCYDFLWNHCGFFGKLRLLTGM